jgi:uncharacterized protein
MNYHDIFVREPIQMLKAIGNWLDKSEAYATEKKFNAEDLLAARLAPDQYALTRQIQSACDSAKSNAARLSGSELPSHPDTEKTVAELRARLEKTIAFLETVTPAAFDGADERKVTQSWMGDKHVVGADYARQFAVPNFHFHVVTSYAILRHNGVPLGKMDFVTELNLQG